MVDYYTLNIKSPTNGQILYAFDQAGHISIHVTGEATGRKESKGVTEITFEDFIVKFLRNGFVLFVFNPVVDESKEDSYQWGWELSTGEITAAPGPLAITIEATKISTKIVNEDTGESTTTRDTVSKSIDVQVQVDPIAPTVSIIAPAPQAPGQPITIDVPETGLDLQVVARAQDNLSINKVEASIDSNQNYHSLGHDTLDTSLWRSDSDHPIKLQCSSFLKFSELPKRSLFVRALDRAGNPKETSLEFIERDTTSPHYDILSPNEGKKIPWSGTQTVIDVSGTAKDLQSGMRSVICKLFGKTGAFLLERSAILLRGANLTDPVSWSAQLPVSSPGWYSVQCDFIDNAGNLTSSQTISSLEVAESFSPTDINDLLGSRQYLVDLLKFFKDHFKRREGTDITAGDLQRVFLQEFERLAKHTDQDTAQHPVNQVRLCIEILRKFLNYNSRNDMVWVEDALPEGAQPKQDNDAWNWILQNPTPISGTQAHQSTINGAMHQHFFDGAKEPLSIVKGERLFAYIYIDPQNIPQQVMLQWKIEADWEHRAYWGADKIAWGTNNSDSRRYMGPLPKADQWVRLEVPARMVGLEDKSINGIAFTLYGGRATWDRAGKTSRQPQLAGHWKLDEGAGTDTMDATESGNKGSLQGGATWNIGLGKPVLSLDGIDDFVQIGAPSQLVMSAATSVSAWICPKGPGSHPTDGGVIIAKEGEYGVARFHDGTIRWAFGNTSPGFNWINTNYVASQNQWTHIVVTYDNGLVNTYANGTLVYSYQGTGLIGDANTLLNDFRIGGRQSTNQQFQGLMSDIRIYQGALSATEVYALNAASRMEREYGQVTYEILLQQLGTSYEELRLARGATQDKRKALAVRLGIDRNPQWSNYLDLLLLEPQEITEARLESLFGLMDTTQDPFTSRPSKQLLDWQLFQLRAMWVEQDHALIEPIIDPDLIGKADLAKTDLNDPAFALWDTRFKEISSQFELFRKNRENKATALDGLSKIANDAMSSIINNPDKPVDFAPCNTLRPTPLEFLRCLDTQQRNGKDIQPILDALYLELPALQYLIRILRLAESPEGTVTDTEWVGVYHILTQVWKGSQRAAWRAAEINLAISPQFFRLYQGDPPRLPCTGAMDGALLSNGAEDPNWVLTAAPAGVPTGKVYVTQQQPGPWVHNNDRSHWISPSKDASIGNAAGTYIYQTKFDLSGWDLTTVQIIARIAVDNELSDVKLNGKSLGLKAIGYQAFVTLSLSGTLVDGENTVEFNVINGGASANPTGLRVELAFASQPRRVQLPQWRVTERARRDWQTVLRARIDQEDGMRQAFDVAIQATEEASLPMLRDTLIQVIAAAEGMAPSDAADWLSERLLIETKGDGWRLTTRVLQATETLQSLIFSLRTQRLLGDHPANSWALPKSGGQFDTQDQFDEEWLWAGSYDSWRAAMLVFYYPENILLPSLREADDRTPQFKDLIQALRAKSRLTPETARALAQEYLDNIRGFGKLAHWKCDEGTGLKLSDSSGNGNIADLQEGAAWTTSGRFGSALSLDGKGYAKVSHSSTLEVGKDGNDFSVSFWIRPIKDHTENNYLSIMHKGNDDTQRTFALWMMPENNRVHFRISTDQDPNAGGNSTINLEINKWNHIAYVKSGSQLKLYVNGILDEAATVNLQGTVASNDGPLYLGKDPWYDGIKGDLDEIRIYDYALPDWAIANLAISEATVPKQLMPPFILTDERTESDIQALRGTALKAFESYLDQQNQQIFFKNEPPLYLKEIFYFVPLAIAIQLQKSGEYTAALDWIQTVYAYNLPADQRKIYPGLIVEKNGTPILSRTEHWLRLVLNPHNQAENRAYPTNPTAPRSNPYTRYTLMSLTRCFMEYADAEFTRDMGDSLAKARSLYLSARSVLAEPDFDQIQPEREEETLLPNPVLEALRNRIENQLTKLRQGRNIAGMKRVIEIPVPPKTIVGLPTIGSGGQLVIPGAYAVMKPTPYRFSVLMERSKQLVSIAQQIEAAYLAALEKRDSENYNLKKAGFDLELAEAGNKLQALRETEAADGETLTKKQKERATKQKDTYQKWIDDGLLASEQSMIKNYEMAEAAQIFGSRLAAGITISQALTTAATSTVPGPAYTGAAVTSSLATLKMGSDITTIVAQTAAQINSIYASHERRVNDWQLSHDLAVIDEQISDQQLAIAQDHTAIVKQEKSIAQTQATQARAMAEYLANKFTSAELYEWMSGVLAGVYSYFLQQATGVAKLAENQLTFERQEAPTSFIQSDYWEVPSEGGAANAGDNAKDRRGMTGSARLLQDIYQLDQYAFETNKRKLNLTHTISLAALDPYAFEIFRETGVLNFHTPMRLFDEAFPGHYLRLIKRVRTSVVALIPPMQGIRATLTASGISRVVIGGDVFQETTIRRDSELVALSSPINATGVFELDAQSELLMPFESMGVDTSWEFEMPGAANQFDFNTIADIIITIDYTALYSDEYRRQVIQQLDPLVSADRAYSIRNDFPDIWYDLNNPDGNGSQAEIQFRTERTHFPPNLDKDISVKEILFAVLPKDDNTEIGGEVALNYTPDIPTSSGAVIGSAILTDRRIHTRLPAGNTAWGGIRGKRAIGTWKFNLPTELSTLFRNGAVNDILVVITFSGTKPQWPS